MYISIYVVKEASIIIINNIIKSPEEPRQLIVKVGIYEWSLYEHPQH